MSVSFTNNLLTSGIPMARQKSTTRKSTAPSVPRRWWGGKLCSGRRSTLPPGQSVEYTRLPITNCGQCHNLHMKGTVPSTSERIMAPTTFHQFALLPVEIQTEIWKCAAGSAINESRVIPVIVHWTPGCLSQRYSAMKDRTPIFLTPISIIPPLLHVCSVSRSLALPIYELVDIPGKSSRQNETKARGTRSSALSGRSDKGTGIYINLKSDIIYFTNHDVFDKLGNQHFPVSDTHADMEDNILLEPQICRPCSDLTLPLGDALRLIIGDASIRKELRNIGFGFEVPGLKRNSFRGGRLDVDFPGLRRIIFGFEKKGQRSVLRNGKTYGRTDPSNSTTLMPPCTTPSAYTRNECFEKYKKRFDIQGGFVQNGMEYMMVDTREQFFVPLINRLMGPHRTGPGMGRNWLQWGIHGLVPFGWKGTGAGEEWEEDGGEEWNQEFIGPRVEFLVVDGKDGKRTTKDIVLV